MGGTEEEDDSNRVDKIICDEAEKCVLVAEYAKALVSELLAGPPPSFSSSSLFSFSSDTRQFVTIEEIRKEIKDGRCAIRRSNFPSAVLDPTALQMLRSLKPFQLAGVQWLIALYGLNSTTTPLGKINAILADETGLGKAVQAVTFLNVGYALKKIEGKALIITKLEWVNDWMKICKAWGNHIHPLLVQFVRGTNYTRQCECYYLSQPLRHDDSGYEPNLFILPFEYLYTKCLRKELTNILETSDFKVVILDAYDYIQQRGNNSTNNNDINNEKYALYVSQLVHFVVSFSALRPVMSILLCASLYSLREGLLFRLASFVLPEYFKIDILQSALSLFTHNANKYFTIFLYLDSENITQKKIYNSAPLSSPELCRSVSPFFCFSSSDDNPPAIHKEKQEKCSTASHIYIRHILSPFVLQRCYDDIMQQGNSQCVYINHEIKPSCLQQQLYVQSINVFKKALTYKHKLVNASQECDICSNSANTITNRKNRNSIINYETDTCNQQNSYFGKRAPMQNEAQRTPSFNHNKCICNEKQKQCSFMTCIKILKDEIENKNGKRCYNKNNKNSNFFYDEHTNNERSEHEKYYAAIVKTVINIFNNENNELNKQYDYFKTLLFRLLRMICLHPIFMQSVYTTSSDMKKLIEHLSTRDSEWRNYPIYLIKTAVAAWDDYHVFKYCEGIDELESVNFPIHMLMDSPKISRIVKIVNESIEKQQKVVIFSSEKKFLELLEDVFQTHFSHISFVYLRGGLDEKEKDAMAQQQEKKQTRFKLGGGRGGGENALLHDNNEIYVINDKDEQARIGTNDMLFLKGREKKLIYEENAIIEESSLISEENEIENSEGNREDEDEWRSILEEFEEDELDVLLCSVSHAKFIRKPIRNCDVAILTDLTVEEDEMTHVERLFRYAGRHSDVRIHRLMTARTVEEAMLKKLCENNKEEHSPTTAGDFISNFMTDILGEIPE